MNTQTKSLIGWISVGAVVSAFAAVGIYHGQMQSDLNAGGFSITNIVDITDTNGNSVLSGSVDLSFTNNYVAGLNSNPSNYFKGTDGANLTNIPATSLTGTIPTNNLAGAVHHIPTLVRPTNSGTFQMVTNADGMHLNLDGGTLTNLNRVVFPSNGYIERDNSVAGFSFAPVGIVRTKIGGRSANLIYTSGGGGLANNQTLNNNTTATTAENAFWASSAGTWTAKTNLIVSGDGTVTNGVYFPSNQVTAASVAAGMTNGAFWMGTISNGLHTAWMSNNVVQWKLIAP